MHVCTPYSTVHKFVSPIYWSEESSECLHPSRGLTLLLRTSSFTLHVLRTITHHVLAPSTPYGDACGSGGLEDNEHQATALFI